MSDRPRIEQLSPSENKGREMDSLKCERSLLLDIESFLSLKTKSNKDFDWRSEMLIENLTQKYISWQSFGYQEGLNSGGIGEAFARFVGLGILKGFPEVKACDYHSGSTKRIYISEKWNPQKKVNLRIETDREIGDSYNTTTFQFNCSLPEIQKMLKDVKEQTDLKREEYHKLLNL